MFALASTSSLGLKRPDSCLGVFNANLFNEVLVANRECRTAILKVASEGLANIVFNVDNFESEYFMVSMEDVD